MPKLFAYKNDLTEPIEWIPWNGNRAVFHKIEVHKSVDTQDGAMLVVSLKQLTDIHNPATDIAVIVGRAKKLRKSGIVDPQSPELWFWDDKFWVKGRAGDGTEYYRNHKYLLYSVDVSDFEELLGQLNTGYE